MPRQERDTSEMLLECIKCERISKIEKVMHINLNGGVAISNIFDIGYTLPANSYVSLP